MQKIPVNWNPVKCKHHTGEEACDELPGALDIHYNGTLLSRIMSMPKKQPIGFASAIRMLQYTMSETWHAGKQGEQPGESGWFYDHFTEWISMQGFHIELTGDEFEPCNPQEKTA